jgi:ATP-binding cassette subfamily B protein
MDPHTENLIQEALDKLMEGRTAVLIAHRLSTIRHVDRILFLENGKIQEQGTHDTLVGLRGRYYRMFSLQTRFLSRTA